MLFRIFIIVTTTTQTLLAWEAKMRGCLTMSLMALRMACKDTDLGVSEVLHCNMGDAEMSRY